jgi:hypothetical protein
MFFLNKLFLTLIPFLELEFLGVLLTANKLLSSQLFTFSTSMMLLFIISLIIYSLSTEVGLNLTAFLTDIPDLKLDLNVFLEIRVLGTDPTDGWWLGALGEGGTTL